MKMSDYQKQAKLTAFYPQSQGVTYCALGLNGEAGEVAEVVKKVLRDKGGKWDAESLRRLDQELGDVLWYLAQLATEANLDLGRVALRNITKLKSRAIRGALDGSGDDR